MIIETDYVPSYCDYLTASKKYKLTNDYIVDDDGVGIEISLLGCSHLDGRDWAIVEPKPFDITKHEFNRKHNMTAHMVNGEYFHFENIKDECAFVEINKADIIAMCHEAGVTAEDLS